MNVNLIDKLDEIGMLYFVIVSLFSAETLVDVESCEASLKGIEILRARNSLKSFFLNTDNTDRTDIFHYLDRYDILLNFPCNFTQIALQNYSISLTWQNFFKKKGSPNTFIIRKRLKPLNTLKSSFSTRINRIGRIMLTRTLKTLLQ